MPAAVPAERCITQRDCCDVTVRLHIDINQVSAKGVAAESFVADASPIMQNKASTGAHLPEHRCHLVPLTLQMSQDVQ